MSQKTLPPLPNPMTLPALQQYVSVVVRARNFTTDVNKVFILLVEEMGELSEELDHWFSSPEQFDRQNLSHEIADILMYLLDLANGLGIDLVERWPFHEEEIERIWVQQNLTVHLTTKFQPGFSLNELGHHLEQRRADLGEKMSPESHSLLISQGMGEIARDLRKGWRGKQHLQQAGNHLVEVLSRVLRMGNLFEVDFEQAVREKEQVNKTRTWSY